MNRLVIVSNRVGGRQAAQAGGLATALQGALRERGGIWFGWSGQTRENTDHPVQVEQQDNVRYITLDLSEAEHAGHYTGFSNRVIWPLFHDRLGLVQFRREDYDTYQAVNQLFARKLIGFLQPGDVIWIHDYHLIPLAATLRSMGVRQRIGFFLHIPLPSARMLRYLPCHEELMDSLVAYDLIGLQSASDLQSLEEYFLGQPGVRLSPQEQLLLPDGGALKAEVFPISIDVERLSRSAVQAAAQVERQLQGGLMGRNLIIGVDRLDYSKGIAARFHAFERFLQRWPAQQGAITFLQVAPPSRREVPEYQELQTELEQLSGHINGIYARPDWLPLHYINRALPQDELAGYYRAARVALVTPLRDGMNLVAKEYVACQDPTDPGVLILSCYTGAAEELDTALQVNPLDPDAITEAMAQALAMPLAERRRRWLAMIKQIRRNDINRWRDTFLQRLMQSSVSLPMIKET